LRLTGKRSAPTVAVKALKLCDDFGEGCPNNRGIQCLQQERQHECDDDGKDSPLYVASSPPARKLVFECGGGMGLLIHRNRSFRQ
jgi:hypothetical protein